MIPYKMTTSHDPSKGQFGDCFRTVIASFLELPINDVPHFFASGDPEIGWDMVGEYLSNEHDLMYFDVTIPPIPFDEAMSTLALAYPGLYLILIGMGIAGNHAVIVKDGVIVCDPSWTNFGLSGPTTEGYWSLGILASGKHRG